MTRYLLDTTALIDFSKNREPARSRILEMIDEDSEVQVCAINIAEFYAGVAPEHHAVWDEFFDSLGYSAISWEAAKQAGNLRYTLARQGVHVSTTDALVAAVALERHSILVTDNPKDFPVDGLRLFSVRD